MIHGVFGKLGSGKGLLAMDIISKELLDGFRDVVTNVPIRTVPWVNGQGLPQLGLRAYLLEKLYPLSEEDVDDILKRVKVIEDVDQGHDMYLWRRDGDTGEWFKLEVNEKDEKGRPARFDAEPIKKRHCAPVLCVTDEAWQFYPNNGGWSRAPILTFFSKQQRKLRDEWFIVTQHPTDVDINLWNIAQDFWVCRNHGMERMGMFRQPEMFRVIVYLTNPAKGGAIRSHEFYRRLDKKLSQCYDTTAGVGIGGGHKGDANQKKSGLHIAWLVGGIVLLVALLAAIPLGLRHLTTPFLTNTMSGGRNLVPAPAVKPSAVVAPSPAPAAAADPLPRSERPLASEADEVFCTGFSVIPSPRAFLSDGSIVEPPELTMITKNSVIVSGRTMKLRPQLSHITVPAVPVESGFLFDPPFPAVKHVNQADVTVIGVRGGRHQPPPRLGGFGSMQKTSPQGQGQGYTASP